jgi:hypothetical protein
MDVLAEADRKYTAKLAGVMAPVMIDAFFDIYAEAKKQSQGRKTLLMFQGLLVEVKGWNNTMVKQHTDAIIKSCAMFPNLLAAVFVISVKIMSAVRISSESKKLNVKLPTNDVFVHSCYIAAAKDLYDSPYIVVEDIKDSEKRAQLTQRFSKCIREVIDDFIPIQQILDTYIPSFAGGELDMENGVGADPCDIDEEDEALAPATTEPGTPATEEPATPSPTDPAPTTPEAADVSAETKDVPVTPVATPATPAPAPVHQETLFDDAPEKK